MENEDPNIPATDEKPEEKVDVADLQRQLEHSERMRKDAEDTRDHWHGVATAKPAATAEAKVEVDDLDELSAADLVDIVSGNDKQKFSSIVRQEAKKLLKEMGVSTKADVEQIVTGKLDGAKSEAGGIATLVGQHPDLADSQSELYQEAARQLDEIGKDNSFNGLSDIAKVKLATKLAVAELKTGGKKSAESERDQRIANQQGKTGSRNSSRSERDDELNADEKEAARIFGVTEKDFAVNKKAQRMFR